MRRTFLAALFGLAIGQGGVAFGMGGNLGQPSISIPVDMQTREADRVVKQIAQALQGHTKEFTGKDTPADRPCDCELDHVGWGAARAVTLTIYLGGGRIDPDALDLPLITGQAGGTPRK